MGEEYEIAFDRAFRNYCLAVLRNAAIDIYRREKRDKERFVPLDDVVDLPKYQEYLSYNEKFDANSGIRQTFTILGVTLEFYNDILFRALNLLSEKQRQIVLLYYCLDHTDASICSILGVNSRSTVHYQRKIAIERLQEYMKEFSEMEEV